jgi:hypothetical protein
MSINGKKMKERQKSVELQSQTALDNQTRRLERSTSPGTERSTFEIGEIPSGNHFRYIAT